MSVWDVAVSRPARADIQAALRFSAERFGIAQAAIYYAKIASALEELEAGPDPRRSSVLADRPALRRLPLRRPARHILFYRVAGEHRILVLRLLHDAMDIARHLPPDD